MIILIWKFLCLTSASETLISISFIFILGLKSFVARSIFLWSVWFDRKKVEGKIIIKTIWMKLDKSFFFSFYFFFHLTKHIKRWKGTHVRAQNPRQIDKWKYFEKRIGLWTLYSKMQHLNKYKRYKTIFYSKIFGVVFDTNTD
jgi:hypothetical protein